MLEKDEMNPLIVKSTVIASAMGAEKIFFISDNWYPSTFKVYSILVEKLNEFKDVEIINQTYFENNEGITSK